MQVVYYLLKIGYILLDQAKTILPMFVSNIILLLKSALITYVVCS